MLYPLSYMCRKRSIETVTPRCRSRTSRLRPYGRRSAAELIPLTTDIVQIRVPQGLPESDRSEGRCRTPVCWAKTSRVPVTPLPKEAE